MWLWILLLYPTNRTTDREILRDEDWKQRILSKVIWILYQQGFLRNNHRWLMKRWMRFWWVYGVTWYRNFAQIIIALEAIVIPYCLFLKTIIKYQRRIIHVIIIIIIIIMERIYKYRIHTMELDRVILGLLWNTVQINYKKREKHNKYDEDQFENIVVLHMI